MPTLAAVVEIKVYVQQRDIVKKVKGEFLGLVKSSHSIVTVNMYTGECLIDSRFIFCIFYCHRSFIFINIVLFVD